jgi:hypothetical protein
VIAGNAIGIAVWPTLMPRALVSTSVCGMKVMLMRLKPTRNSLTSAGLKMCVSLTVMI